MKESKRKELETRAALGPRLPRPPRVTRVTAEPLAAPGLRTRVRAGKGHPTRDGGRS